jgi:cysteinyl-tRNA synthetase
MYLTSLSKSSAAIRTAAKRLNGSEAGQEGVKDLVEGAGDVLGPYLGETVRTGFAPWSRANGSSATR